MVRAIDANSLDDCFVRCAVLCCAVLCCAAVMVLVRVCLWIVVTAKKRDDKNVLIGRSETKHVRN
jgi:hypothetical protein